MSVVARGQMAAVGKAMVARKAIVGLGRGVSLHRRWAANSLPRVGPVMMYRFRAD